MPCLILMPIRKYSVKCKSLQALFVRRNCKKDLTMENNYNNSVDNSTHIGYNGGNDENVEVVKMDEQKPINDTECRHEVLIPDPKDTIGDAVYHGCANHKCGVGFYINKDDPRNKNLT